MKKNEATSTRVSYIFSKIPQYELRLLIIIADPSVFIVLILKRRKKINGVNMISRVNFMTYEKNPRFVKQPSKNKSTFWLLFSKSID